MPEEQVGAIAEETVELAEPESEGDLEAGGVSDDGKPQPRRGFFLLGLMIGSAVGAALALLYTPKLDENTALDDEPSGLADVEGGDDEEHAASADDQTDTPL